jgi:hypothetical protein
MPEHSTTSDQFTHQIVGSKFERSQRKNLCRPFIVFSASQKEHVFVLRRGNVSVVDSSELKLDHVSYVPEGLAPKHVLVSFRAQRK